jgi:hypothetical protein
MRPSLFPVAIAVAAATLGCATEYVDRPPTPRELSSIRDASDQGGPITIRYVQPVGACTGDGCVEGASAAPHGPATFAHFLSVDDGALAAKTTSGVTTTIPLSEVEGITLTGRRGRSAAIGAAVVGGTAMAVTTVWLVIVTRAIIHASDGGNYCNVASCAPFVLGVGLGGAAVGALFGAVIGTRTTFELDPP